MDEQAIFDNNYTDKFLFYFEKKFERKDLLDIQVQWTLNNWTLSIYYSIGYIILVFLGRRFMRNREKFRLNRSLIAWNILHSVFSVLGAIRLVPGFVDMLYTQGLDYSICEAKYDYGIIGEWSSLFVISKMVDLFDTAFIILRKQNLLFLHWYHHTASLIYSWHSFKELASTGRFFSVMNISAHALMYPYYLCRSLRFNVSKFVMISITSLQTLQVSINRISNIILYFISIISHLDGCRCLCEFLCVNEEKPRRILPS